MSAKTKKGETYTKMSWCVGTLSRIKGGAGAEEMGAGVGAGGLSKKQPLESHIFRAMWSLWRPV